MGATGGWSASASGEHGQPAARATHISLSETLPNLVVKTHKVPLKGSNAALSGKDLLVGSVSLLNLYDFLKNYRAQTGDLDRLYEKNVRRWLGIRGRVNKAIQQTLKVAPERFGLYNNGITIVVADFTPHEDGTLELIEPYVVNGCQTTRTIGKCAING